MAQAWQVDRACLLIFWILDALESLGLDDSGTVCNFLERTFDLQTTHPAPTPCDPYEGPSRSGPPSTCPHPPRARYRQLEPALHPSICRNIPSSQPHPSQLPHPASASLPWTDNHVPPAMPPPWHSPEGPCTAGLPFPGTVNSFPSITSAFMCLTGYNDSDPPMPGHGHGSLADA